MGLKLTGGLVRVGVLLLDPMLRGGGLKHGVFNLECVGVNSGDWVGVLSGLKTLVGVVLSFLRRTVSVSPFSLGGGGRDMSDS